MKIVGVFPSTAGQARYQIATCRSCSITACVRTCVRMTCTGSTGSCFFSPQIERPMRPPRTRARSAMTRYFTLKIPEVALDYGQCRDGRGFRPQDPGPEPHRFKAGGNGRFLLNVFQATLGAYEHGNAFTDVLEVIDAQIAGGGQEHPRRAGGVRVACGVGT